MTFSGVNTSSPVDAENGQATASSLSHSTPSVTTTVANTMLVTFHAMTSSSTWSSPAGMTEAFDRASSSGSSGVSIVGSYVVQTGAGATGAKTATASADAGPGQGQIIVLKP